MKIFCRRKFDIKKQLDCNIWIFLFFYKRQPSPADITIPHRVFTEPVNRASLFTCAADLHVIFEDLVRVNRNPPPISIFFHVFFFDKSSWNFVIGSFYRYFWCSCLTGRITGISNIHLSFGQDFSERFMGHEVLDIFLEIKMKICSFRKWHFCLEFKPADILQKQYFIIQRRRMLPLNISGHVDNMGFLFILKSDLKK